MRLLTLALSLVALGCMVSGQTMCLSRNLRKEINRLMDCRPRDAMVPLRVPEDCDEVYPAMIKAPQCNGVCIGGHQKCFPTNSTTKSYTVQCKKEGRVTRCVSDEIEHHHSCKCSCALTMDDCRKMNKILQKRKCKCECSERVKAKCNELVLFGYMFTDEDCSCGCPDNNCLAPQPLSRLTTRKNKKVKNKKKGNRKQRNRDLDV